MFNKKELETRKRRRRHELLAEGGKTADHGWDAYAALISPQEELKARLNAFLNWVDPGDPIHWRGL